jgi:predicted ester cyclase
VAPTQAHSWARLNTTGRTIDIDVIDIARFVNGMMVEHWGVPDRFALLLQLGLFLPAGGWRPHAKP